jgi:hypothetical protein
VDGHEGCLRFKRWWIAGTWSDDLLPGGVCHLVVALKMGFGEFWVSGSAGFEPEVVR